MRPRRHETAWTRDSVPGRREAGLLGMHRASASPLPPLDRGDTGRGRSAARNGRACGRGWWCAGTRRRVDAATRGRCRRRQCGRTRGRARHRAPDREVSGRRQRGRFAAVRSHAAESSGRSTRPERRGHTASWRNCIFWRCGRTWSPTCGRTRRRLSGPGSRRRGARHRRRRCCRAGNEPWLRWLDLAQSCVGEQKPPIRLVLAPLLRLIRLRYVLGLLKVDAGALDGCLRQGLEGGRCRGGLPFG